MSFRAQSFLAFCRSVFGNLAMSKEERLMRFFEEAAEVAQAGGMSREIALKLVDRAYERPGGVLVKELGQAMLTLELYAEVLDVDLDNLAWVEVTRCLGIPAKEWHARHAVKEVAGLAKKYDGED